jgi:ABC-type dipeptide/oligopeptide/nickel transport system permease component
VRLPYLVRKVLQLIALLFAVIVLVINLLTDVAYAVFDPRVKLGA